MFLSKHAVKHLGEGVRPILKGGNALPTVQQLNRNPQLCVIRQKLLHELEELHNRIKQPHAYANLREHGDSLGAENPEQGVLEFWIHSAFRISLLIRVTATNAS